MTKAEIIKYLKENEFDFARANAAMIACDFVFSVYVESDSLHGVLFSPGFCYFSSERLKTFYQIFAKDIIYGTALKVYENYLKDPKSLDTLITEHERLEREIDLVWRDYLKIRKDLTTKKFLAVFEKFRAPSRDWWKHGAIGEDKGAAMHEVAVPKFAERHAFDPAQANHVFNTLSHPEEQAIFNTERELFLTMCLDAVAGRDISRAIDAYIKDYFWFKTDFYSAREITPESLRKDVKKEIDEKGEAGIKKELYDTRARREALQEEKSGMLATLKLSEEDRRDLAYAEKTVNWIEIRKRGMMKDFYYLFTMVGDVAKKNGLTYHDLSLYTVDEFLEFVKTGKRIPSEEVEGRGYGVMFKWEKGKKLEKFYGADGQEMFDAYNSANISHKTDSVKGQVASTGGVKSVTGTVRIIHQPTKEKFEEGEILVTSMTRIEFVPLMRKAKAIITDEGGIACHAAIVSRELGLPCVIGTKIATKVLKDGDVVEVDAERGIVKILERSGESQNNDKNRNSRK